MPDLHLPLKHEWFVTFRDGDKPVEYREITAYWTKRLMEPADEWPEYAKWEKFYGEHVSSEMLLSNIFTGLGLGYIRFKSFGDMVLTDGYPKHDDESRHFRTGWAKTDIGCVNPEWAFSDTPASKRFFRIWSSKASETQAAKMPTYEEIRQFCNENYGEFRIGRRFVLYDFAYAIVKWSIKQQKG